MSQSSQIQVRIDPNIKAQAQAIVKALGLDLTTVIKMLLHQIVLLKKIPLSNDVTVNTEKKITPQQARQEIAEVIKAGEVYNSFDDLWKSVSEELKEEGHVL